METTAGQAMVNSFLPVGLRDYKRSLNKKNMTSLLGEVASKHPGQYKTIVMKMKGMAQKVAYADTSSITLDDFAPVTDRTELFKASDDLMNGKMNIAKVNKVFANLQEKYTKQTLKDGLRKGNSLAQIVYSGSRGKPSQLNSTITSPIMFSDVKGAPVQVPILHSLAEGLEPAEYWAMAPGTRKGVISTKFSTPISGFFNKQLGYVTSEIIVTTDDCHTTNGVKVPIDDQENLGRTLAMGSGRYKAGTTVDTRMLSDLKKAKKKFIILRSPETCAASSGICQKCYGFNERGTVPVIGHASGLNSSAALSEPFTQGALDVKHSGGLLAKKKVGIELVQQMLKVPKTFAGGATVSEHEGTVDKIDKAPQGGFYVSIKGKQHYVSPGLGLKVKVGDDVEPGSILSDGVVNPADITRLRGIGEGKRFLSNGLKQAYIEDGKGNVNKIHMESLASKMVDHVKITDHTQFNDFVTGDIVSFSKAQKEYAPKGVQTLDLPLAKNKFLAKPLQHYTVGTKLTKSMLADLKETGYNKIDVTDQEPPFTPVMIRLDDIPEYKDNWVERLYSIHLKSKIMGAAHKGEKADIHGLHYSPAALYGRDFGKNKIGY